MGPAGMVSFGHAAYFGLGAYAGALLFKKAGLPMELALVLAPFVAGLFAVVYGWFCVRLSGVYLAMLTLGLRADHLVDRLPVGRADRRQQRPGRRLARRLARRQDGLLLPDARAVRPRHRRPVARAVLAVRLRAARRPRFAAARRGDRHRPARLSVGGLRAGRHHARAWPARSSPSPRAASRPSSISIAQSTDGLVMVLLGGVDTLDRPGRRRGGLHLAARHAGARDRVLARRARAGDPADRRRLPAGAGRRPQGARTRAGGRHERARCCRSTACTRRSAACRRSRTSPSPSRPASCWR